MRQTAIPPIFYMLPDESKMQILFPSVPKGNLRPVCRVRKKGFAPLQPPVKCLFFSYAFADCRETPCRYKIKVRDFIYGSYGYGLGSLLSYLCGRTITNGPSAILPSILKNDMQVSCMKCIVSLPKSLVFLVFLMIGSYI